MRGLVAGVALTLAGCGAATPAANDVPEPPPAIVAVDRIPWGDSVLARTNALARTVDDQMRPRFGGSRERQHVATDRAAVAGLQDWYRQQLGAGWQPVALRFLPGQSGFGFANGDRAIVVAWINPIADGRIPVTTFRYPREP